MESKQKFANWEKEFSEFAAADPVTVPSSLSKSVVSRIQEELHPGAFFVFTKTAFIHAMVGLATLLACPQFGLSFSRSHGLMRYLMQFGDSVCMLGCGAFFTTFSLLVVSLVLKPEEVRVLKSNQILQLASLATLSLGAFLFAGGTIVLALGLIWSLGAILGGAISLQAGWAFRRFSVRRSLS